MNEVSVDREVMSSLVKKYLSFVDEIALALDKFPGATDGGPASNHIGAVAVGAMEVATLSAVVEAALCQVTDDVVDSLLADDQDAADVFAGLEGYGKL